MGKLSSVLALLAFVSITSASFAQDDPEFDFGDEESNDAAEEAGEVEKPTFDANGFTAGDFQGGELPSRFGDYASNPAALGADALRETDPISRSDYDSFFGNNYSGFEFDEWVGSIMGPQDLEEVLGMDSPTVDQDCGTRTETETREVRTTYHCSVDNGQGVENPTCDQVVDYPTDRDYVYRCEEDRPRTTAQWSNGCAGFEGNADCRLLAERCTEYRDATQVEYRCERGSSVEYSQHVCESGYRFDEDTYSCERGEVVEESTYTCHSGVEITSENYTCERGRTQNVSEYRCERGERVNSSTFSCMREHIETYSFPICRLPNGVHYNQCDQESNPSCTRVDSSAGPRMTVHYYRCVDGTATTDTCNPGPNCRETGSTCQEYNESGSCAREAVTFTCESRNSVNTCSPASNCQQTGTRCLESHGGSCIREEVIYSCSSGSNYNNCSPPSASCVESSASCLERNPDGSCARERVRYTCTSENSYDTCSPPSTCSPQSTTCKEWVGGRCVREEHRYACEERHPFNNCAPASHCEQTGTECVARHNGECVTERVNYSCVTRTGFNDCSPYSHCTASSTRCVEQRDGECVVTERTMQCPSLSQVDTCTVPAGCSKTGERCVEYVDGMGCVRREHAYICPGDPAGCVGREEDYRCENPAGPPPIDTIDWVGQPSWRDAGCPTLDPEWGCEIEETVCIEGPGTRIINEVPVYSDCWREQTRYVCPGVGETITDCNPGPECTLTEETCMDDGCRSSTRSYECTSDETVTVETEQCESAISCIGGSCVEVSRESSAQQAPEALAQLAALFQAHESITQPDGSLSLISGDDLRCHKTGIWKNCCTDDGAGIAVDWLNGSCNEQEQELAARREENLCVDVGWYCAKDGWFGCRTRKRTSCCFGSALARIVNEEGREQLGLGWGTPEEPACEGLTPEQFSQVDLSDVDFSEVLGDMTDAFNPEGEGSIADRVQQRVSDFYANGTPGGGE